MVSQFIFIDGSYFCFYKYYSVLNWWKKTYPEILLVNPIENEIFVNQYKKICIESIQELPSKLGLSTTEELHIVVGKDCKREHIWRMELFPEYKSHRVKNGFMGSPFFQMTYEENLFIQGGAEAILKHPQLEADDCIAITVHKIIENIPETKIYIITSDKDYLQLAVPQVKIYNLAYENIAELKSSLGNAEQNLFCKILMGDISDNIPSIFPKCGPKTAMKYYHDRQLLVDKINHSPQYARQLELNRTLIDFHYIPSELVHDFLKSSIFLSSKNI